MTDDLITKTKNEVFREQRNTDGIPLIAVGIYMIIVSIFIAAKQFSLVGIFIIFVPLVTESLRKRFTYPRIGFVKMTDKQSIRKVMMLLILGFLVLGLAIMLLMQGGLLPQSIMNNMHRILMWFVAVILIVLLSASYLRDKNIIYIWFGCFIMFLLLAIVFFRLHLNLLKYILLGFGLVNLVWGLISFCIFIKKYPVLEDES